MLIKDSSSLPGGSELSQFIEIEPIRWKGHSFGTQEPGRGGTAASFSSLSRNAECLITSQENRWVSSPRSKSLPKGLISFPLSYTRGLPGTLFYSLDIPLECSHSGRHNSHLAEQDLCQGLRAGVWKPSEPGLKNLFACMAYFQSIWNHCDPFSSCRIVWLVFGVRAKR